MADGSEFFQTCEEHKNKKKKQTNPQRQAHTTLYLHKTKLY